MYLYLTYKSADFLSSIARFPVGHCKTALDFGIASILMQRAGTALCNFLPFKPSRQP